ncbi:uncharacterized protein ARMOST_04376 [Armillaria ostoyae]|uniref:F-box domain-containing protein n=1 Tax=Armillaria ostoyae TaxID=47428 RepID=A0A284QX68_ARMOS|nr:uncharacterized protein ARMOST_04376 [Armillaria ostoyae]
MPLDILLMICGMLPSRDLINLSRVDAKFCRTLTADNVSFVWRSVREAEEGIEPPRGVPEYRWVELLFGKQVCALCHIKSASVIWRLRRRVCKQCLEANLICASKVKSRFPGVGDDILNLIPHINTDPEKLGSYWISDVTDIQAKMEELKAGPGSSKCLADFRTDQKKLVEDMDKDVGRCEEWTRANARKKANESKRLEEERFSMIKTRLLDLGYTEGNVEGIRRKINTMQDVELTPQGWNRTRSRLEVAIEKNQVQRAKAARNEALLSRFGIVERIVGKRSRQFLPVVWREMPVPVDVCMFPIFRDILELPTEHAVTKDSFADAVKELPNLIANWQRRRESKLRAQVPPQKTGQVDPLKLATTIFSCKRRCRAIITNADIWRHKCVTYLSYASESNHRDLTNVDDLYYNLGNTELSFDRVRSALAVSLIRLASRDPATTTAEEMDSLNLGFLCLSDRIATYDLPDRGKWSGRPVLSWRECVQRDGRGSDFRVLSPKDEAKKRLVVREGCEFTWNPTLFHCQHCSDDVSPQVYEYLVEHLKDEHGVDDPLMDRDLFLTPVNSLAEIVDQLRRKSLTKSEAAFTKEFEVLQPKHEDSDAEGNGKISNTQMKATDMKRRELSLLPMMPLDILFIIFAMLSPQALLNLSLVNANFCRTLTAHNVSFIWKAVREAEGGIESPRGVPEYRWVDLLFGKPVCDFCQAKNVSVDWTLRRRVCKRCFKANLLCASRVRSRFPDVNDEVLNLIPLTYGKTTASLSHVFPLITFIYKAGPGKTRSSSGYYWISDITDIQGKIKELESRPGSSKPLIEFRTNRKKLVEDTYKDVGRCEEWTRANARKKVDDSKRLRDERFSMIKTRLLELGYNERDVQGIRSEPSVVRDVELTPQGWNMVRRGLEVLIKDNRVQQAKADRTMTLFKRSQIVEDVLKVYKQKFLPIVWREMPSYADVCTFPAFRVILELPTEHVVTDASFADAVDELPTLIADWQRRRKSDSDLETQVASLETGQVDPLKLATAVFFCEQRHDAIITNTDLWRHQCVPYLVMSGPGSMHDHFPVANVDDLYNHIGNKKHFFDTTRSSIAASLVQLASRDPATTTAEEMDNLNLQFLSMYDRVSNYSSVLSSTSYYGLPVLSWRKCVQKGATSAHSASPEFDFRLLTPDDEAKKRRHCSDHVDPQTYGDVSKHIRNMHGVDDPRMDRDLFLTPGASMPLLQRPPFYIVEVDSEDYLW